MRRISGFKICAYIFSIIFSLLILFPILFMLSSAVKDDISVYEMPPKIIPLSPKSITFVADYSNYNKFTEGEVLDKINMDCALSMLSTVYEFNKSAIGEIIFYATMDGKTVYRARAHRQLLRLELDFGTYRGVNISKNTIAFGNKYKKLAEVVGYNFNLNGISDMAPKPIDNSMNSDFVKLFSDKHRLEGNFTGSIVCDKPQLMLENFKYYLMAPSYIYSENDVIKKYSFLAFFFNTALGMIIALVTQIGLCAVTAYALSKLFDKRTSNILLMFFLATLMIPFISIFVPLLQMMKTVNIKEGYLAMFFVHLFPDAFFIVIYKGFFDQLPTSLFEAAKIDGAPERYTFTRICLPLSTPVISVIALNTFVREWGNFFWYFAVANNTPKFWTINLAIYEMSLNPVMKANTTMGIAVVMAIPVIILALIFSNKIKDSIVSTGIKG